MEEDLGLERVNCRAKGASSGFKVAILGAAGGIGQPLAMLMKMNPLVSLLHLYDVVNAPGVTADISHMDTSAVVIPSFFFSFLFYFYFWGSIFFSWCLILFPFWFNICFYGNLESGFGWLCCVVFCGLWGFKIWSYLSDFMIGWRVFFRLVIAQILWDLVRP